MGKRKLQAPSPSQPKVTGWLKKVQRPSDGGASASQPPSPPSPLPSRPPPHGGVLQPPDVPGADVPGASSRRSSRPKRQPAKLSDQQPDQSAASVSKFHPIYPYTRVCVCVCVCVCARARVQFSRSVVDA